MKYSAKIFYTVLLLLITVITFPSFSYALGFSDQVAEIRVGEDNHTIALVDENTTISEYFELFRKYVAEGKHDVSMLIFRTIISKNTEEALKYIDKELQSNPQDPLLYYVKGELMFIEKKYEKSFECYERFLQLANELTGLKKELTADVYYSRGTALHYLRKYEQALESFDKAIEILPNFAAAYQNKGNVYKDLRKKEEALKCYDTAISYQPINADILFSKGNALYEFGMYEEALFVLNSAIK